MKMSTPERRYKKIGAKIRDLREKEDMSQQELAIEIGFQSGTAISLIESGARKVAVDDLEKIAKLFHANISELLEEILITPDVKIALRADRDLSNTDRQKVMDFYAFIKNKKGGK